jgi:hypothetical protein
VLSFAAAKHQRALIDVVADRILPRRFPVRGGRRRLRSTIRTTRTMFAARKHADTETWLSKPTRPTMPIQTMSRKTPAKIFRSEKMKSIEERITAWLDVIPGAISGSGGHNQTFRVACSLYNGWGLSESETLRWLEQYNQKCDPPWSASELRHKATDATKAKHTKPRGHLVRNEKQFRTAPVPIQKPVEDTRQTTVAQLRHGDHASFSLFTHACIHKPSRARVCEKRKTSVICVPKSEVSHGDHASFPVSQRERTEKTTNLAKKFCSKLPLPSENSKTSVTTVPDTKSADEWTDDQIHDEHRPFWRMADGKWHPVNDSAEKLRDAKNGNGAHGKTT